MNNALYFTKSTVFYYNKIDIKYVSVSEVFWFDVLCVIRTKKKAKLVILLIQVDVKVVTT